MTTAYKPITPWSPVTAEDAEAAAFALWSMEGSTGDILRSASPEIRKAAAYVLANTLADMLVEDSREQDHASGILFLLDQDWDEATRVWGASLAALIGFAIANQEQAK